MNLFPWVFLSNILLPVRDCHCMLLDITGLVRNDFALSHTVTMASTAPAFDPNDNHDAEIISVAVVFSFLSLLIVVARLWSKRITTKYLQIDDYLLVAAWVRVAISQTKLGLSALAKSE